MSQKDTISQPSQRDWAWFVGNVCQARCHRDDGPASCTTCGFTDAELQAFWEEDQTSSQTIPQEGD